MNKIPFEFHTIQYSVEQKKFHIESVKEYLMTNWQAFLEQKAIPNYMLLGTYATYEEAERYLKLYKKALNGLDCHDDGVESKTLEDFLKSL